MSTFARRLAIPAGQTFSWIAHACPRYSALVHDYGTEYHRAQAATREYETLKRIAQADGSFGPNLVRMPRRNYYA